ncbi:hypothetical protein [Pedobacter sp. NJ-S-72]
MLWLEIGMHILVKATQTLTSSYGRMTLLPGCLNGNSVCAINATGSADTPDSPLSLNLKSYIINALGTLIAQPQDSGKTKKYVYMRPLK